MKNRGKNNKVELKLSTPVHVVKKMRSKTTVIQHRVHMGSPKTNRNPKYYLFLQQIGFRSFKKSVSDPSVVSDDGRCTEQGNAY